MDDARLLALRQDPHPAFAAELRSRLRQQEPMLSARRAWPFGRLAASLALAGGVLGLFTIPAVRASAQSFLALFRVVNFVAVPVDETRVNALKELDLQQLVGEQVKVLQDPGNPIDVESVEQAGAIAGFEVRQPEWLPDGTTIVEVAVSREGLAQVTADAVRLQHLMDALGINDLAVPEGLDGQTVAIRVPPIVMVRYDHGHRRTRLFQARSPEVALPAGVRSEVLGEIGLRILGLPSADA